MREGTVFSSQMGVGRREDLQDDFGFEDGFPQRGGGLDDFGGNGFDGAMQENGDFDFGPFAGGM